MATVNQLSKTVALTSAEIVPLTRAGRRTLIFSAPPANAYELTWNATAVLGAGIRVPAGSKALILTRREMGDTLDGPITAIAEGAPVTVGVTEIYGD